MKIYDIYTLADFYEVLSNNPFNRKTIQPIWFRGHEYNHYTLAPSIQRFFSPEANDVETYSQMTLRESNRYQHFASRATHSMKNDINAKIEWQEVYQHHFGKTRMMDWSESAHTALSFALISYLDTQNDAELVKKRRTATPVVWMLDPHKLNENTYDFFRGNKDLIRKALNDLQLGSFSNQIYNEMNKRNSKKIYFEYSKDSSIDGILSLSALDAYRTANMSRMNQLVKNLAFNPFYYLSLRYYIDGVPCILNDIKDVLPPLAILQPYHSERIKQQRGVFTVFPNYILKNTAKKYYELYNYDIRIMENQPQLQDCLVKLNIINPIQVARDLAYSGERKSELYPDVDEYVHIIEAEKLYI